jgi:hypothetical protein
MQRNLSQLAPSGSPSKGIDWTEKMRNNKMRINEDKSGRTVP